VPPPIWLDEYGHRVPTYPCPKCDREWPVYRHRLQHLIMAGWKPMKPMLVVNWRGPGFYPHVDGKLHLISEFSSPNLANAHLLVKRTQRFVSRFDKAMYSALSDRAQVGAYHYLDSLERIECSR
jgi:hypothetical protein